MSMKVCINEIWAKKNPFQSVLTHGEVSGICAHAIYDMFLCDSVKRLLCDVFGMNDANTRNFVSYLVSLHDIGKIAEKFQEQNTLLSESIRHEKSSIFILQRIWYENYGFDRRTSRILSEILGAHHQGKNGTFEISNDEWQNLQNEYEKIMRRTFLTENEVFPTLPKQNQGSYEAVLLGITVLSDWISSGSLFENAELWQEQGELKLKTEQAIKLFLEDSGMTEEFVYHGKEFSDVWPNLKTLRDLQRDTFSLFGEMELRPRLLLMEAPMGEGKTEAAIYAAEQMAKQWKKNGFYIGLPTSATSNQMQQRINDFFSLHSQNNRVKLLHSTAWMNEKDLRSFDTEEEKYIYEWMNPSRRGMLAPYAVGTVDQAMMASMLIKYGVLRLLGLAEKVLIFDEIHAYDLYMMNILKGLLEWCKALEIPVIMLSATLPLEKKKDLLSVFTDQEFENVYPSITAVDEKGAVYVRKIEKTSVEKTYQIELSPILRYPERIADYALKMVEKGGCLCLLVNTVGQAQKIYSLIQEKNPDIELHLFHSRFSLERRNEIERLCISKFGKGSKNRPSKAILVATQVVEQSLDVDFDRMISSIAPMDLLLQRMGRQYRHEETKRPLDDNGPLFTILIPEDDEYGSDGYVYDSAVLRQTQYLLRNMDSISIPNDVQKLVERCYSKTDIPPEHIEEWDYYEADIHRKAALSDPYKLASPDKKYSPLIEKIDFDDLGKSNYLSAKTRLGEAECRITFLEQEEFISLYAKFTEHKLDVRKKECAEKLMRKSCGIREKLFWSIVERNDLEYVKCTMLLEGTYIVSDANPYICIDEKIGLQIKEVNDGTKI